MANGYLLNAWNFFNKMAEQPEVMQCYFFSRDTDYLLVVHVSDMGHYNDFALRVFANEPNIKKFFAVVFLSKSYTKYNNHVLLP